MNITCPYCGAEYHPSEIFIPSVLIGKPVYIRRNIENKIESLVKDSSCNTESYVCDYCNNEFSVIATMKFDSKKLQKIDMEEDHFSKMFKSNNLLSEE